MTDAVSCPSCGKPLTNDLARFEYVCAACGAEYRRRGGELVTREEWDRTDPDRIPRARVVLGRDDD